MTPHKKNIMDPAITEVSETEAVSGTESFSSDHSHNLKQGVDTSLSLDSLFSELSKETKNKNKKDDKEEGDEFSKIKAQLSKLPQISSRLEESLKEEQDKINKKTDILRINDPITHALNREKQIKSKDSTSGDKWFNMKAPELTPEIKRDLLVIKHRSALDPKRHYKKEKWETPKHFQMGTVIEGNTEGSSARLNRKARGTTLVDEILKDEDSLKYFKRKFSEIREQRSSGGQKHYKKMKDMRKRY